MASSLPPLGADEDLPILKKNEVSTGIRELDIILEGGYHHPGAVMIKGPPGMEKIALTFHFAVADKNTFVVFVAADAAPDSIKEKASTISMDLNKDNISFIDVYSATVKTTKGAESAAKYPTVPGPSALNDLSLALNDVMKKFAGKKLCIIFYSLSTFLIYNSKDSILKFLQVINGRLKNAGATALFLVEEGVHEKVLLNSVERFMDERFNVLTDSGGASQLEITELGTTIKIKLGPNGISIP